MWNDMAMQGGLSLLKAGMGYIEAKREAKSQKQWQDYRNKMVRLADGQNQNSITINRNEARTASAKKAFAIDRSEFTTEATAEVSAAAMGVTGRSVNHVMFDIQRNAAYAQQERLDDLNLQNVNFDNQRRQSAFQAMQNIDVSPIPKPNAAEYLLGAGADIGKLWKSQKDDDRARENRLINGG